MSTASAFSIEAGKGPRTLNLLHAGGSDADEWDSILPSLVASGYRVLAPDQIGHGRSEKPSLNYRLTTFTDFAEGFCHEVGVVRATLFGHSLSDGAVLHLGLSRPDLVEALVLIDAGYAYAVPVVTDPAKLGHNAGTLRLINPATLEQARQLLVLAVADPAVRASTTAAEKMWTTQMRSAFVMGKMVESFARSEDTADGKLAGLSLPVLVLWGDVDGVTPAHLAERFGHDIANSQVVIFDRCGHSPHEEHAERFLNVVGDFLKITLAS